MRRDLLGHHYSSNIHLFVLIAEKMNSAIPKNIFICSVGYKIIDTMAKARRFRCLSFRLQDGGPLSALDNDTRDVDVSIPLHVLIWNLVLRTGGGQKMVKSRFSF